MAKSSPQAPPVPDPNVVAAAQTSTNRDTAIANARLNQINEVTPFGSAIYSPTGQTVDGIKQYQRTVTLSPDQQRLLDLQNALSEQAYTIGGQQVGRIGDALAQPLDFSSLPAAPSADPAARQQVQDAMFARAKAALDPVYDKQLRELETNLANQGFATGSEGYRGAIEDFRRAQGNAYQAALQDAIIGGGAEQSRLFGLEASARERAMQEMFVQRNAPINELAALLGTSGGVNVPQFGGIPQTNVGGTDITGPTYASYNAALGQYNQAQAQRNSLLGSIFGLGGAALGAWASDERLKTDKQPFDPDEALEGVRKTPVYSYRYKASGNPNMGPMARDWAKAFGGDGSVIEAPAAFGVGFAAIKALADKVAGLERRVR